MSGPGNGQPWQQLVPEALHGPVQAALGTLYGGQAFECLGRVTGGASGALALRLRQGQRDWLMRVESGKMPMRNPHQYACMEIAAQAGIAPPLHYVDADNGVAVMDFVATVPLDRFPGGAEALAGALGALARDLQATAAFPELFDFRGLTARLLAMVESRSEPGLLDLHREALEQLTQSLDWDSAGHVSSHNDPNPQNVLFDGERLWLIDWESACRNDPYVDLAIMADTMAGTPAFKRALLAARLGRSPRADEILRLDRLAVLSRLYYAGLLFAVAGPSEERLTDLAAPTPEAFQAQLAGATGPTPQILRTMARMRLRDFLGGWRALERS